MQFLMVSLLISSCVEPFAGGDDCFSHFSSSWHEATDVADEAETASSQVGGTIRLPAPLPPGYSYFRTAHVPSSDDDRPGWGVSLRDESSVAPLVEILYADNAPCEFAIYRAARKSHVVVGNERVRLTVEGPRAGEPGLERIVGNLRAGELFAQLTISWRAPQTEPEDRRISVFKSWAALLIE